MADARNLLVAVGSENAAVANLLLGHEQVIDPHIFIMFYGSFSSGIFDEPYTKIRCNQDDFEGVYQAALANDDVALADYRQRDLIDVFSLEQIPLTAAGKLAAQGQFQAVAKLVSYGANERCAVIGAASGGQIGFIRDNKNQWLSYAAVENLLLMMAAYHNQREIVKLVGGVDPYYRRLITAAGYGKHFDYVEEMMTKVGHECNAIDGLTWHTFDCLRASLPTRADGLRFLAQFESDAFRANIAWRLDADYMTEGNQPMLSYKVASLVSDANLIRRLMNDKALSYEDASAQVVTHPYYTRASLAANSLFASASALAARVTGSAAKSNDDSACKSHESNRRM